MIALRAYRALPKGFRLWLIDQLPPHRRLWLVRRLTRLPRGRARAAHGSTLRVRDGDAWVKAVVVPDASPFEQWHRNLADVTRALDDAGIDYFCLRPANDLRSAVAVPGEQKEEVLRLLRASPLLAGAKMWLVDPAGRRLRLGRHRQILQVFRPVTDPAGAVVLGRAHACEVEFWASSPGGNGPATTVAPRPNRVATALPAAGVRVLARPADLSRFAPGVPGAAGSRAPLDDRLFRSRLEFTQQAPDRVMFPIDAVYTWVDGGDPDWQRRKAAALDVHGQGHMNQVAANNSRYVNRDELRYSLRSITSNLPWIRHIYLVTDDQMPSWLDVTCPMVTVVPHRVIFGQSGVLPTFNSHAIESRLHLIPGLAEHFIYVNDDMFFGRPVPPTAFFHANGIAKFFPSPAQLEAGPATVHDTPVTAAGKNNRRVFEARFGRTITQKMRHVPYPLRKSVLEEIAQALPGEVAATAAHQFRHPEDLSIPSSLQHYWGFLTGRAVAGSIKYTYADLAHPSTPVQLAFLLRRRPCDVFCLNDTDSSDVSLPEQHAMLAEFLPAYFPFRAPFELPDEVTAERATMSPTELARLTLGASALVPPDRPTTKDGLPPRQRGRVSHPTGRPA